MVEQGITQFIELGSGTVLSGLIKRIAPQARTYSLGEPEDFANFPAV
jgi:[acyl-carrier-protein] S-malonyltransferase